MKRYIRYNVISFFLYLFLCVCVTLIYFSLIFKFFLVVLNVGAVYVFRFSGEFGYPLNISVTLHSICIIYTMPVTNK